MLIEIYDQGKPKTPQREGRKRAGDVGEDGLENLEAKSVGEEKMNSDILL